MNKFLDLLKESVIVQALITLIFSCVLAYMYVKEMNIPQELLTAYAVILGYYFGSKVQNYINR